MSKLKIKLQSESCISEEAARSKFSELQELYYGHHLDFFLQLQMGSSKIQKKLKRIY